MKFKVDDILIFNGTIREVIKIIAISKTHYDYKYIDHETIFATFTSLHQTVEKHFDYYTDYIREKKLKKILCK